MIHWIKKHVAILLFTLLNVSCSKSDAMSVTIQAGTVERVNGCHIKLDHIIVNSKASGPAGDFYFVCNVGESALKSNEWWGDQPQPLQFSMQLDDCVRLDKKFYCVEKIDTSDGSITLTATYEQRHWDGALLQRIK